MKGSGFIFDNYERHEFIQAIYRAIGIYSNDKHYQQLRRNSFDAAIDVADVGRVI
jgi:starch synthase